MMFDINSLKEDKQTTRYLRRIEHLISKGTVVESIKNTVENSIKNINEGVRSFVIYGEPQSGKTEMMIALTGRLIDEGHKMVIILLNDSIQLLEQNLSRFRLSGIDPAPRNFNEILDPAVEIKEGEWIIFSKKNSKDLNKLIAKIGHVHKKVIIDDEADYATPNGKINTEEKTKINELTEKLIGSDGIYIGVTATPARLDLNNTHNNQNQKWVDFLPHPLYIGQETFFPTPITNFPFRLNTLPDQGDDPKHLRNALFSYLVNVAYINVKINEVEKNYSILIHTSGKKADHNEDFTQVTKIFEALKDKNNSNYEKYYKNIFEIAERRYKGNENEILQYIHKNRNRYSIIVMNSDKERNLIDNQSATKAETLFTIVIGGNIVSRGVTFENLLSMFFTRDVKHKIQQDTYIQRARMFGSRGEYLKFFELTIPEKLYMDWHKCFIFHRLSLASRRTGNGSPVWLENQRVSAVSSRSIDKTTVSIDNGEMSFEIFEHSNDIEEIIEKDMNNFSKLELLSNRLGNNKLPDYLINYIKTFSPDGEHSVAFHKTGSIVGYSDADQEQIRRPRSFIGNREMELDKYPHALHHIKILMNENKKARVFYKYRGSIRIIKNTKTHN